MAPCVYPNWGKLYTGYGWTCRAIIPIFNWMNFASCPIMSMESSSFWIGINHVGAGLTCLRRHLCPKGRFLARVVRLHRRPAPTAIDIHYRNLFGRLNRFRHGVSMFFETPGLPVWQYNYYETSIRHESDLNRIVRRHMPLTKDNFSQVSSQMANWRSQMNNSFAID